MQYLKRKMGSAHCPTGRVFNIGSGVGQNTGYRVQFGSGRSVEIYNQVFTGIFFNLGYFGYFRVYQGISGIYEYLRVYWYIGPLLLVVVSKTLLRLNGSSGDLEDICTCSYVYKGNIKGYFMVRLTPPTTHTHLMFIFL